MRNPLRSLFDNRKSSALVEQVRAYLRDGEGASLVGDDAAFRVATFNSCVRLVAGIVGSLPLHVYRRLPDGGKQRQYANSLDVVLQKPNAWQSGMELREQLTSHLLVRGNAFAWIDWSEIVSPTDNTKIERASALIPLHPDLIEVVAGASWQDPPTYFLRRKTGTMTELPADAVLHIRGMSTDGLRGRSLVSDARETIGVSLETQRFASRLFRNDATPGIVLKHPGELGEEVATRLRDNWDALYAGNARRTAVLEEGMTLERLSLAPEDAQFLQTRDLQRSEICGLFPVPPHLVGMVDKSTSWGTGIEQQNIQFLTYCIGILARRWEQALLRYVVVADRTFFVEHVVEGLLRADIKSRYGAYAVGRQWGWLSVNDIRARENMNPIGPDGDVYLQPLNMVPAGDPLSDDPATPAPPDTGGQA